MFHLHFTTESTVGLFESSNLLYCVQKVNDLLLILTDLR